METARWAVFVRTTILIAPVVKWMVVSGLVVVIA